jgi:hypothetical protein
VRVLRRAQRAARAGAHPDRAAALISAPLAALTSLEGEKQFTTKLTKLTKRKSKLASVLRNRAASPMSWHEARTYRVARAEVVFFVSFVTFVVENLVSGQD